LQPQQAKKGQVLVFKRVEITWGWFYCASIAKKEVKKKASEKKIAKKLDVSHLAAQIVKQASQNQEVQVPLAQHSGFSSINHRFYL
jgi:hypothetical protein